MNASAYKYLILDIGSVLLLYTAGCVSGIPPRQVRNALESPLWYEYERGNIAQHECDSQIAQQFGFDVDAWRDALGQRRDSLQPNRHFVAAIKQLRLTYPELAVYGLTNMPKEDFEQLRPVMSGWGILDGIFPSALLGCRKPDIAYFEKFLSESKVEPTSCIFMDGQLESVITAQSMGFRGLLFEHSPSAVTTLHSLLGDPVARGLDFLHRHARNMVSETSEGELQPDNYSQLLILQCIGNRDLVTLEKTGPLWNYFIGEPRFADTTYPTDSDTTALAMTILDNVPAEEKEFAMQKMLSNVSPDGLPLCWFDPARPRFCHCIGANVLRFFCLHGQGHRLSAMYVYLCRLLKTRAYLLGTRYYESPDWLLYILADLCAKRPSDAALRDMRDLVHREVRSRMGCNQDILSTALRLVAAQALGLANPKDLATLLESQQLDGGWERVWLWRYGKEKVKIGGRGVVTAMAVRGIQMARARQLQGQLQLQLQEQQQPQQQQPQQQQATAALEHLKYCLNGGGAAAKFVARIGRLLSKWS